MSYEYPRTLAALRDQEDRSWAVADALVAEIRSHPDGRVLNGEYDRCAAWLAANGYEVTPRYLMQMRQTAAKFVRSESTNSRQWAIPFRLYMAAAQSANWTPALMEQAELNGWTLRQFSKALTGKDWADSDVEAAKRALASPAIRAQVIQNVSAEDKGELAREMLADPEVADAAFNRTDLQEKGTTQTALGNISRARTAGDMRRIAENQAKMPPAAREVNDKIGQSGAKLDLEDAVTRYRAEARRFAETVAAALPKAGIYSGASHGLSLAENVVKAREVHQVAGNTLDALDSYVSGGGGSLDDELEKIMEQGNG